MEIYTTLEIKWGVQTKKTEKKRKIKFNLNLKNAEFDLIIRKNITIVYSIKLDNKEVQISLICKYCNKNLRFHLLCLYIFYTYVWRKNWWTSSSSSELIMVNEEEEEDLLYKVKKSGTSQKLRKNTLLPSWVMLYPPLYYQYTLAKIWYLVWWE